MCSTLQNKDKQQSAMFQYAIQQMAAIPAASDALARFTGRVIVRESDGATVWEY